MPVISKSSLRRQRHDKSLLRVVLLATAVIAIGIVLVPMMTMDTEAPPKLPDMAIQSTTVRSIPDPIVSLPKQSSFFEDRDSSGDGAIDPDESPEEVPEGAVPITDRSSGRDNYHTVFSTGCSTFQDWQSYVFFYHILHSGQEGPVTRIASGCSDEDASALSDIFETEIASMAPERFRLHLTPDFSKVKPGANFKYFNKPFGMQHWMQEVLGYPDSHAEHDDTIVILLDPDQILIRAFTKDFTHSSEKWRLKTGYKLNVEHGSPFAAQYGYGLQWKRKVKMENVFLGTSPVAEMTDKEAMDYYYGMGPPYIATGKDMYTIVSRWAEIVPRVHDDYPHLLAEMFAFNLAAAHEGLRFTIAHSFMVSDVYAGGEGWKLIDVVPAKDICANFPKSEYPHVIHYCQRYYIGKWFIGKYKLRKDFVSCESPLLTMPPAELATLGYTEAITPSGEHRALDPKHAKEQAFMVCTMIRALNEAAIYYKDHHCAKATANYDYSYVFHKNMTMLGGPTVSL